MADIVVKLFDSYLLWSLTDDAPVEGRLSRDDVLRTLTRDRGYPIDDAELAVKLADTIGTSMWGHNAVDIVSHNRAGPYGAELAVAEVVAMWDTPPAPLPPGTFTFTLLIADASGNPEGVTDEVLLRLRAIDSAAPGRTVDGQPAVTFSRDEPQGFIEAVRAAADDIEGWGLTVRHAVREGSKWAPELIPLSEPSDGPRR